MKKTAKKVQKEGNIAAEKGEEIVLSGWRKALFWG